MDINVTLTLDAPAITEALMALVGNPNAQHYTKPPVAAPVSSRAPVAPQPVPPPSYTIAPVQAPVTVTAPTPIAAPTPAPAPVPTTAAPAYTLEVLANAAAGLMSAGKQPELLALLGQFGAQSMSQLKTEQYGAFATALRQMGGKL